MSYVYVKSESWVEDGVRHELFTVGFYKPDGSFESESDHSERGAAADRVAWLNGSIPWYNLDSLTMAANRYLQS